ncbi:acyltransferase family protein [Thermoleophilum album]|uniref:acyltransferase family protein n=1 Tax=Thermoleophilum album TaxID=29539 RepID=UPI000B80C681|nr:acyltransferase [Thermoleophilum album]
MGLSVDSGRFALLQRSRHSGNSEALAPPPGHPRFPSADGVRAIAIACVLAVHSWAATRVLAPQSAPDGIGDRLLAHLNVGVAIFFALSGFLLYRPFIAGDLALGPRPSAAAYLWRRGLRILPAYWLALGALALVPGDTARAGDGVWAVLPLQGLAPAGERSCVELIATCRFAPVWSLTVELTFYALLPAYATLMSRVPRRQRLPCELLVLGTLAAVSTAVGVADATARLTLVSGTVAGHFPPFAAGMLAAVLSARREERLRTPSPTLKRLLATAAALLVYSAAAMALPPSPFLFTARDRLIAHLAFAVIATCALVPLLVETPGRPARSLLASRPLRALGLVSYGIFLWHYTFALAAVDLRIASWPLSLVFVSACSLVPATASYLLVERPALRLKNALWGRFPTTREAPRPPAAPSASHQPSLALRDD